MKAALAIIFATIGVLVVGFALWVGGVILQNKTANFRGNASQISKTRANGDYRIASYDHFFDLCASIQDQEVTIDAQSEEMTKSTTTSERRNQIWANISALTANRGELINHYNADARKAGTAGQFRDSSLPYQIPLTTYTIGEHTTCVI